MNDCRAAAAAEADHTERWREEAGGAQQTQSKLRLVSAAGSETAEGGKKQKAEAQPAASSGDGWPATLFKA